ncbi:MAG: hypothetical protein R2708_26010 [Vicinamibacterales bacterium]
MTLTPQRAVPFDQTGHTVADGLDGVFVHHLGIERRQFETPVDDAAHGVHGSIVAAGQPRRHARTQESTPVADSAGMVGAISHGLTGLVAGFARLDRAASAIARDDNAEGLAEHAVDLLRARQDVRAGVAVVRTADELVGTILDVFA